MKPVHFIAVAVRIFAIALFLHGMRDLTVALWGTSDYATAGRGAFVLFAGIFMAVAALLWFFPLTVASRILPGHDAQGVVKVPDADELYPLAFIVLGVYLFYFAVSDAVYWLTMWSVSRNASYDIAISQDQVANMVATAVELVFATILILRARGIANVIRRLRKA